MANPSLQIGNSNWAIKEDNLLGYSTAGTKFLPQPITMTRASAGTRVNPQGLVETVELLGSELVVNGDFATDTDWTKGTGWTISNGKATGSNTSSSLYQATGGSYVSGKTYEIVFTVSDYVSGSVRPEITNIAGDFVTSNGTFTQYIVATSSAIGEELKGASFTGSIDNISIKESTKNNLARVDYDGTASSLLVEPQRTNLVAYSEDFSNAAWTKSALGIDTSIGTNGINPNIAISPDGTQNADRVNFILQTNKDNGLYEIISASSGNSYTTSVYLKGEGDNIGKTIKVRIKRLSGGSFVVVDVNYVLTGEWFRLEMNPLTLSGANTNALLIFTSNDATNCLIYGCQVEQGSYPTSYIPTSGSTVTRVQDQYSKTGISNLINSEEGVLFVEAKTTYDSSTSRRITLSDGSISNRVSLEFDDSVENKIKAFITLNGASETLEYTAPDLSIFNKIAIKWKANDFAIWFNGGAVVTETAEPRVPTGMTQLSFDGGNGANFFYGQAKQLQVFKTALTDTELATLTT